jgi:hypothetical protein
MPAQARDSKMIRMIGDVGDNNDDDETDDCDDDHDHDHGYGAGRRPQFSETGSLPLTGDSLSSPVKSCHSTNKCPNEACHPKKFKKPLREPP